MQLGNTVYRSRTATDCERTSTDRGQVCEGYWYPAAGDIIHDGAHTQDSISNINWRQHRQWRKQGLGKDLERESKNKGLLGRGQRRKITYEWAEEMAASQDP